MNIGEVFLELGFDVDEQKLKDFDAGIKGLETNMLKLSAAAAGSVLGLDVFLSKVTDRATAMKQFGDQTGYSMRAFQEWALVINQTNPLIGIEQAQEKYKAFTEYVKNINWGAGGGGILSQLGVNYIPGADPNQYLEELSKKLPGFIAQFGRARAGMLLDQIGVGAGSIDALLTTQGQRDRMTQGLLMPDGQVRHLDEVNEALARFDQRWRKFEAELADKWGDPFIAYLNRMIDLLNVLMPKLDGMAKAVGGWQVVGEVVLSYFAGKWALGMLGAFGKVANGLMGLTGGIGRGMLGLMGVDAAGLAAGGAFVTGAGALAAGAYLPYWLDEKTGWGQKFADWAAPVKTPQQVMANLNKNRVEYLARDGNAGDTTVTNNLTQNIHSTADAGAVGHEAARAWDEWFQKKLDATSAGINLGPDK
jgi:hypothetical protein